MITHFFASLPVLLFFVLGFTLKRLHFFERKSIEDFKRFILIISVPALLFRAFLTLSIETKYLLLVVVIFFMAASLVPIGKLVARIAHIKTPYFPLLMSGFEMSMFAYALFISLYGIENLGALAFLGIGQTIFTFSYLMAALMRLREGKQSPLVMFKRFFGSPIVLAIGAGLLVGAIAPPFDSHPILRMIDDSLRLVGSITVPLITMTIGYDIVLEKRGLALSFLTIVTRKVFLLVFALLINRYIIDGILQMPTIYRYAMMVLALTPPTFLHSMLVRNDDAENIGYINRTLSLDCIISVFATMIMAAWYV